MFFVRSGQLGPHSLRICGSLAISSAFWKAPSTELLSCLFSFIAPPLDSAVSIGSKVFTRFDATAKQTIAPWSSQVRRRIGEEYKRREGDEKRNERGEVICLKLLQALYR